MSTPTDTATDVDSTHDWREAGEAWGHSATDWAYLYEHYALDVMIAIFQRVGIADGVRVLDVACGSGLALRHAEAMGATTAGIDAAESLIEIARDRNPDSDLRLGSMFELPWADESFDAVMSINGVWGGCEAALGGGPSGPPPRRHDRHQLLGNRHTERSAGLLQGVRPPLTRAALRQHEAAEQHRRTRRRRADADRQRIRRAGTRRPGLGHRMGRRRAGVARRVERRPCRSGASPHRSGDRESRRCWRRSTTAATSVAPTASATIITS